MIPEYSSPGFRALRRGLDLILLLVLGAIVALLLSGGYDLALGGLRLSSHRLGPLLRVLLPLGLLRLWLAVGWRNLLLLSISLSVALGITEVALRWTALPLARATLPQIHRPSNLLEWELVPGAEGVGVLGETIRINADGFRDDPPDPAPRRYRIAVLGDSFTFGMGVELPAVYHQQLEQALRERGWDVEVMAFGVIGYQLWQLRVLLERVLAHQPDLVILGLFMDDIERPEDPRAAPDWRPHNPFLEDRPAPAGGFRVWNLLRNIHRLVEVRYRYWRGHDYLRDIEARKATLGEGHPPHPYRLIQSGELPAARYRAFAETLGAMVGRIRRAGADCLIAYIPDASQLHEPPRQAINRFIADLARDLGVPWVDFTPAFEAAADPERLFLFPFDAHTSPAGHALMAGELLRALRAYRLLPGA